MKKSIMKFLSYIMVFMLAIGMNPTSVLAADLVGKAPITVSRTVAPTGTVFAGQDITITYTIKPDPIAAQQPKAKEIIIVMDKSGSMAWDLAGNGYYVSNSNKRITIAKNAAISFIDKFAGKSDVKISFIDYDYLADVYNSNSPFREMSNSKQLEDLKSYVSNVSPGGGTNIGDGIRRTFYTFQNKGASNTDRFMVFLTDGEPTVYTGQSNKNNNYKLDDGTGSDYSSEYYGLGYANTFAQRMTTAVPSIKSYYIAFSTNGANKLKEISDNSQGSNYKVAVTANDLTTIYNDIADQIISYSPLNDIYFEETFPDGITIVEKPNGSTVVGQTIQWNIPPIAYKLNTAKTEYVADPISFSVKVKAGKSGDYTVGSINGGQGIAYIEYTDLDGVTKTRKDFTTAYLSVHEVNPPVINMSQEWQSQDRTFTLTDTGSGNIHFDGVNDYINFDGTWHDQLFGPSQDKWTIRATIKPESLGAEYSNHGTKNVFLAKASDSYNDNLEIGIDNITKNLMLYIDGKTGSEGVDTMKLIGNGELTAGVQHDVIVTFDNGKVTVSLDGNTYEDLTWSSRSVLDKAVGSPLTFGGTLHIDTFYNGKINKVDLYNTALYAKDIYAGPTSGLYATYNAINSSATRLDDDSGNGRHSTSVSGALLQNNVSGTAQLQYKIGATGTWTNYIAGSSVLALDQPGEVTVYARTVHSNTYYSDIVSKSARLLERGYIDNISLSSNKTTMTLKEQGLLTYSFKGSEILISGVTGNEKTLADINVTIKFPATVQPLSATGLTNYNYNAATNTITGKITNAKMIKQASGKYKFEQKDIGIVFKPSSSTNIAITGDSVDVAYKDSFNKNVAYTGGNPLGVIVRPGEVSVSTIAGDNVVDQFETSTVVIKGTADANALIDITISDGVTTITQQVTANGSGAFTSPALNLKALKIGAFTVNAKVTDSEGDSNEGSRNAERKMIVPNVDIL